MCLYWFQQASIFLPGETANIVTVEVSPEKKLLQELASIKKLFKLELLIPVYASLGIAQEGFILQNLFVFSGLNILVLWNYILQTEIMILNNYWNYNKLPAAMPVKTYTLFYKFFSDLVLVAWTQPPTVWRQIWSNMSHYKEKYLSIYWPIFHSPYFYNGAKLGTSYAWSCWSLVRWNNLWIHGLATIA